MKTFDGFFIPQHQRESVRDWRYLEAGGVRVRYPALTVTDIQDVWTRLSANRERVLRNTPVADIIAAIDQATARLRESSKFAIDVIGAATGYSSPVVEETLDHMFGDWNAASLETMLAAELGDPRVLDGLIEDPTVTGKRITAFGYPKAFHVFSGNVPGVAVTSLIRSLLVKSATLGKTAAGEPVLPVLFANALHDVAPEIASCIAVSYWPHTDEATQNAAIEAADVVVAYGGAEAVHEIQTKLPTGKPFVVHGPRVSFGIVGPHATTALASDVAAAVAAYDQQGCVSPHLVYVVGDAERARTFAGAIADGLRRTSQSLPRGTVTPAEAVAIRNARTAAEFAAGTELLGTEADGFSVIFESSPEFRASCLNRVVYVKALAAPGDVARLLPHQDLLQSAAVEGFADIEQAELARTLGLLGVSRITSFARLPWPPMHWHHDGGSPIRELLRWQDVES